MSEVKLLWIDDDPERESTAKKLEEKLNSGIEFLCVNGKDVEETISKNKQRFSELDLVIMDHRLDTARSNSIKTGATASSLLREGEGYESLPILCVTSEPDLVDNQQRLAYQGVIDFGEIISKTYVAEIKSIINGFKDLKDKPINSIDSIFDKLRSSYEAKENLIKVLPKELKTNFEEPTYSLSFHRWLKRTLIGRPGFLYDRLWVSTYLGLNETGFSKVEHLFTESLYSGIFCSSLEERWWKTQVSLKLNIIVDEIGLSWKIGRQLPEILESDYAKDAITKEEYPEIVAFIDSSINAGRYQVKIKNTIDHPGYEDLLFFETIKILKPQS